MNIKTRREKMFRNILCNCCKYFLGLLDRTFNVLVIAFSEWIFMYFGVFIITSVLMGLYPHIILHGINQEVLKVTHDEDILKIAVDIVISGGLYFVIYSKTVFRRLIYIITGKEYKE